MKHLPLSLFFWLAAAEFLVGVTSPTHAMAITLSSGNDSWLLSGAWTPPFPSPTDEIPVTLGGSGNTNASSTTAAVTAANYSFTTTSSESVFSFESTSSLSGGNVADSRAQISFMLSEQVAYTIAASSSGNLNSDAGGRLEVSLFVPATKLIYFAEESSVGGGAFGHQLGGPPDGNLVNSSIGSRTGFLAPGSYVFFVGEFLSDHDMRVETSAIGTSHTLATLRLTSPSSVPDASVPDATSTSFLLVLALVPFVAFTHSRARRGMIRQ